MWLLLQRHYYISERMGDLRDAKSSFMQFCEIKISCCAVWVWKRCLSSIKFYLMVPVMPHKMPVEWKWGFERWFYFPQWCDGLAHNFHHHFLHRYFLSLAVFSLIIIIFFPNRCYLVDLWEHGNKRSSLGLWVKSNTRSFQAEF